MSTYDLIVRGGTLVMDDGPSEADIAVADGKIADIAPEVEGTGKEEVDAQELHLFPGAIDAHAHFSEPAAPTGRASRRAPKRSRQGA